MRKLSVGILLFVLLASFVFAQTGADSTGAKDNFEEIKDKTDSFVEIRVPISEFPDWLQGITRAFTKINEDPTLSYFIVFIIVAVLFFFIFDNIMTLFSPFGKGTSAGVSIVITLLTGALWILKIVTDSLFYVSGGIKAFADWSIGSLVFIVVIVAILWVFFSKLARNARRRQAILRGEEEGIEAGATFGFFKAMRDMIKST